MFAFKIVQIIVWRQKRCSAQCVEMHWNHLCLNLGNDLLYNLFVIIQRWLKCEHRDDASEPSSVNKYSLYRRHANDDCSWRMWLRSKERLLERTFGLWTHLCSGGRVTSSQRFNLKIFFCFSFLFKNKLKNVITLSFLFTFSQMSSTEKQGWQGFKKCVQKEMSL